MDDLQESLFTAAAQSYIEENPLDVEAMTVVEGRQWIKDFLQAQEVVVGFRATHLPIALPVPFYTGLALDTAAQIQNHQKIPPFHAAGACISQLSLPPSGDSNGENKKT